LSEYSVITERVAEAFAAAGAGGGGHAPTLLAGLTFVLLNRVFQSWYERSGEIGPIVDEVVAAFHDLSRAPRQHAARHGRPSVGKPRPSRRLQNAR